MASKELRLPVGLPQAEQDRRLERGAREARNAVRLRAHENVVAVHDVVPGGLPWIVMALAGGRFLKERLDTRGAAAHPSTWPPNGCAEPSGSRPVTCSPSA
ncbi:hypothetical protein [Nonomuraea sp. NPDC049684]|uniref:hypothetical protein n=1 Tax=Nonomuraea sp. NPDC049684 TaxID=3364356 RepID=UPI0037A4E009